MEKKDELKNDLTREEKILLEEYRNAQLSAQHHDTLVWTVTSIFWATNALLIRVVVTDLNGDKLKGLSIAISLLGLFLCMSVWKFAKQFNKIMRQKYSRCKEIERRLGMTQHYRLKYSPGKQRRIYRFIMLLFIMLWLGIILYVMICNSQDFIRHWMNFFN